MVRDLRRAVILAWLIVRFWLKGGGLLSLYKDSMFKLLSTLYPDHPFHPWLFKKIPTGFWANIQIRQAFFQHALATLRPTMDLQEIYHIPREEISKLGGAGLLTHYRGDYLACLKATYPKHVWQPWRFPETPRGYWNDKANQRAFLDWVKQELNVKDWSGVTADQIKKLGGACYDCAVASFCFSTTYPHFFVGYSVIARRYGGSIVGMLSSVYPEEQQTLPHRVTDRRRP
jgi:hypothetical protein